MNWKLLALPVSIVPFVIIAVTFNISIENLLAVGIIPFAGASVAMACKLFTQGLKFNYLVKKFLGPVDVNWKTISVRIGSEFVTSTTPSFVGGELVRRSEEHTSELQSRSDLVCRLLLEKKK